MRMEQYLTHTDYALWEVIVNGDAPAVASVSAEGSIPPKTAEQKLARKNELKAKSTLLLAIPDEHLLKFHRIKDAKTLWEAIKASQSSSSSNSQNVDFVSSDDTSSTNEVVNTAHDVPAARSKGQASSSTYADDVIFSFFVNQSNSLQLDNEDLEQINTNDLEEIDLKWHVAMLSMRVECYNCHMRGHFAREYKAPRNQGNRNGDAPRRIVPVETPANALVFDQRREVLSKANLEIIAYQLGLESLEARIVIHQKNKAVYEEDIRFLKYDVKVRDNSITKPKNQLVEALREKDDLKLKLEKFETSSMKLTKLINNQISVNNKSGVGFDSQMNENELHDCHLNKSEVFESASDSSVNEIEEKNNQVNDRFKKVEGYHAVPPPYTGNYMPSRPDLSFAGLDDFVYKTNVSETISSVPRNESTASKSSKDSLEQPKDVRPSAPIIKE
ncbi:ribonuclease H-like domain-containing protein [Tanacetum coccineum]